MSPYTDGEHHSLCVAPCKPTLRKLLLPKRPRGGGGGGDDHPLKDDPFYSNCNELNSIIYLFSLEAVECEHLLIC